MGASPGSAFALGGFAAFRLCSWFLACHRAGTTQGQGPNSILAGSRIRWRRRLHARAKKHEATRCSERGLDGDVVSLAPIFELQIGYAAEVTKVSSDNGCTRLKGDGGDAKVVLADVQLHLR